MATLAMPVMLMSLITPMMATTPVIRVADAAVAEAPTRLIGKEAQAAAGGLTMLLMPRATALVARMDKVAVAVVAVPVTELEMLEVLAPNVACQVIDWALQVHGGGGVSDDFGLARAYASARTLRFADGPDEVHRNAIAKQELGEQTSIADALALRRA